MAWGTVRRSFHGAFIVGSEYGRPQSFMLGLKTHERNGEGQIQRVTGLTVRHRVSDVRGACRDDITGVHHPLIAITSFFQDFLRVLLPDRNKPPSLPILRRWGQSCSFQYTIHDFGIHRTVVEGFGRRSIPDNLE
jgi:hypothetical protein